MKRFVLFFALLLLGVVAHSQQRSPLQGKVMIGDVAADDGEVYVRNLQARKSAMVAPGGFFTISAKAGDSLEFSGIEIITQKKKLSADDVKLELLTITLASLGTQLKEVTVDGKAITSESLGIVPAGQKKYTPAQRKLQTATTTQAQREPDKAYTAIGTDGAINAVSGRTKQLKKEAKVEKKENWKAKLTEMYDHQHFTDTLRIPEDYVEGFLFYAVDDSQFVKTMQTGNPEQIDLQLAYLAMKYKKTLKGEAK